jgi:hypothetical protein
MNQLKRRMKYQYGTLTLETRTRGPCVWTYRYFDWVDGRKRRRKAIVGTVEQYRTSVRASPLDLPPTPNCSARIPQPWVR